jgi:hypothetical protein
MNFFFSPTCESVKLKEMITIQLTMAGLIVKSILHPGPEASRNSSILPLVAWSRIFITGRQVEKQSSNVLKIFNTATKKSPLTINHAFDI